MVVLVDPMLEMVVMVEMVEMEEIGVKQALTE